MTSVLATRVFRGGVGWTSIDYRVNRVECGVTTHERVCWARGYITVAWCPLRYSCVMSTLPDRPALVSVVMPTFGRPEFLERAIASVRRQTFGDWVLYVVDDNEPGSVARQETEAAIQRFSDDRRIRYYQQSKNMGACVARNTGASLSDAEYLAFLDDDDEWLPAKLERQLAVFTTVGADVAIVYAGYRRDYADVTLDVDVVPNLQGHILTELLRDNFIGPTSSVIVRRSAFEAVGGFDAAFPASQDYDLYLRIARRYAIRGVPEVLTLSHRHTAGSIGGDTDAKLEAFDLLLERHADLFDVAPDARTCHVRRMATRLVHRGRGSDARRVLGLGLRARPFDLRLVGLWGLSFWPRGIAQGIVSLKAWSRTWRRSMLDR